MLAVCLAFVAVHVLILLCIVWFKEPVLVGLVFSLVPCSGSTVQCQYKRNAGNRQGGVGVLEGAGLPFPVVAGCEMF